jgi:hypothetical protein
MFVAKYLHANKPMTKWTQGHVNAFILEYVAAGNSAADLQMRHMEEWAISQGAVLVGSMLVFKREDDMLMFKLKYG